MLPAIKIQNKMKNYTQTVLSWGAAAMDQFSHKVQIKVNERDRYLTGLYLFKRTAEVLTDSEIYLTLKDNRREYFSRLHENFLNKETKRFSEQFLPVNIPILDNVIEVAVEGRISMVYGGSSFSFYIIAETSDIIGSGNLFYQTIPMKTNTVEFITPSGYTKLKGVMLLPKESNAGTITLFKGDLIVLDNISANLFAPKSDVPYLDSLFEVNIPVNSSRMTIRKDSLAALTGQLNLNYSVLFVYEK